MSTQPAAVSIPEVNSTHAAEPNPCLVDRIAFFIERFVFVKERPLYRLLALWVIHTHLIDAFDQTGYVFANSPEAQSGKTRLLEILDFLVYQSSGILTSPTEAVLFRTAKGHTQLLDEVDVWHNMDFLRGILNAGSRRGGTVFRCEKSEKGEYKNGEFPVFGARALSGIGMHILPEATRTRTFSIGMVRQTRDERREKFRSRVVRPEAQRLASEIREWVAANRQEVTERYGRALPYLEQFGDRTIDVCEPLAAILEVAYKDSPDLARIRLEFLHAIAVTRAERSETLFEHRILEALCLASRASDPLIGTASELAAICGGLGVKPDEFAVSRSLRAYGFETKSIRREDGSKRRYSITNVELTDVLGRYACGSVEGSCDLSTTQPTTVQVVENGGA